MFHYLENKDMESSMRQNSGVIMRTLCSTLKKQYGIGARPFMVGSGRRKLITRNGAGPVDLDYNLEILKCPPLKDWKELKEKVQMAFNHALEVNGQKDCKKSTSVLTAHIATQGKIAPVHYSIDVCVVRKNKKGHYDRLILEKHECAQKDRCYWNEAPDSTELLEKVEYIKSQDRWIRLKEEYLNRKNHYLRSNDHNHPSFICYVEAVNNVYNEIRRR